MHMNLQYFADAGTLVNGTENYVNANDGTTTAFTDSKTLSPELKAFYDTELLENARTELFYAQFAKRQPLPANHKGQVEWRKWNTFERALIRDALLLGTNVLYCDNITLATGAVASTPASCAQMEASATAMSMLTPAMINKAVTIMKKNRVPRINGRYYAVIHPSVAHDLRACEGWIEAHKYAAPEELFNGEIGELHGVRFIENVFAPVLGGSDYQNKAGSKTYATYFFGKDAFGIIDPEGGALEMIIHDKGEIGGPLNQFSTIGYKFETNGATILYPERLLRVMSCSSFSGSDEEN